jgi:hypothetical protein
MKISMVNMYAKTWNRFLKQSSHNLDYQKGKRVSAPEDKQNKRDEKEGKE